MKNPHLGKGQINRFSDKEIEEVNERMEKAFERIRRESALQQLEAREAAEHIYINM